MRERSEGVSYNSPLSHCHAELTSQLITRERVSPALQHDCSWPVPLHDPPNDRLEQQSMVRIVTYAIPQWYIDGVTLALADAYVSNIARAGEEVAELVEGDAQDSVS